MSRNRSSHPGVAAACAGLVLAAAACQPMPRPFEPDSKVAPGSLADLGPRARVHVRPVDGAPGETAERLSALVAAGLRDRDIPGTTSEEGKPYVLRGEATLASVSTAEAVLALRWRLFDPFGQEVGAFEQLKQVDAKAWAEASPALLAFLAEGAAARLDALLSRPGARPPEVPLAPLFVAPVDGAPGDGRTALTAAIRGALEESRVPIAEEIGDDTYLALGSVHVEDDGPARQTVEVYWTLIEPSGREIGVVSQSNSVPKGALDGAWGEIARAVAEGGAEGILRVLRAVGPMPEGSGGE